MALVNQLALQGVSGPLAGVAPPPPVDFDPTDIFGLEAWWRGDSYVAGTWTDLSGRGRTASQATGANQPALQASVQEINSKPSVLADGSNDFLQTAGFTYNQPKLYVATFRAVSWANNDTLIDSLPGGRASVSQTGASPNILMYSGSSGPATGLFDLPRYHLGSFQFNGAFSYMTKNSILVDQVRDVGALNDAGGITLFSRGDGAANWGNFEIADIAIYSTVVGAYEKYKLENLYEVARYAIPSTFDPTSITGCQAWYKGDALALGEGASISSWVDSSGNGRNATQGTGGIQPVCKVKFLNNLPVAYFDGNDYLQASTVPLTQPTTVFMVAWQTTNVTAYLMDGDDAVNTHAIVNNSSGNWRLYAGNGVDAAGSTLIPRIIVGNFNGASSAITQDGVKTTGNAGAGNSTGLYLGARGDLASGFLTGYIGEVIVYNNTLTDAQRQTVEGYLSSKWAINAALRSFDPRSISNCMGWWRVHDGCDVIADGSSISTLYDRSGNGRHYTQATAASKPTYKTNILGSLAAASFDGGDSLLTPSFTQAQNLTIVTVLQKRVALASQIWAYQAQNNGGPGGGGGFPDGDALYMHSGAYLSTGSSSQIGITEFHVMVAQYSGATSNLWIDGRAFGAANAGANTITAGLRLGSAYDGTAGWDGYIAEQIVYSGTLTTQDRLALEAYLYYTYDIGYKTPAHTSLASSLLNWYKASDQVFVNNDPVDTLVDTSGGSRNLTQGTAGARPTFKTYQNNGYPALDFDGGDYLSSLTAAPGAVSGLTIFVVVKRTGGAGNDWVIEKSNAAGTSGRTGILIDGTNAYFYAASATTDQYGWVAHGMSTNNSILVYRFDGAATGNIERLKAFINALPQTLTFTGTIPAALDADTVLSIGANPAGGDQLLGQISEVAIFNGPMSLGNIRAVINYLGQQYNIAV